MTPQQMNYFVNLLNKLASLLREYADFEDLIQAGFDLGIDQDLSGIDFQAEASDVDHLSETSVAAMFQAFTAVQTTMDANSRQRWAQFLEVLRSWTR